MAEQPERTLSRKSAIEIIQKQVYDYSGGDKTRKGEILNILESVLHRDRKSIIRTINKLISVKSNQNKRCGPHSSPQRHLPRKPGRPLKYSLEANAALHFIWIAYNYPCAERIHPEITEAIRIFVRDNDWKFSKKATTELKTMSLASVRRRLVKFAHTEGLIRGFSTTRSSGLLRTIPIFHGDWSSKPLGYGQIDTVVHSGPKLMGTMVYTVDFVEMQTYWVELEAQLGKSANTTLNSIKNIHKRLPFILRGLHPDSGDEFINDTVVNWVNQLNKHRKAEYKIELTRSRPSKKNDNCNVEERNNMLIRKYVGYERYDCKEAVEILNQIYHYLCLYNNFFQPTFKIVHKYRKDNGQWVKEYDEAKSPFRRLLERSEITNEQKMALMKRYDNLNPRKLLARIEALTIKLRKVQQKIGYHFIPDDTDDYS